MIGLTPQQQALYTFMAGHKAEHGIMPSIREMAKRTGVGITGVYRLLECLEVRGCIRREKGARAIELLGSQVTLKDEILILTDRYANAHGISRDTAANELLRAALGAA